MRLNEALRADLGRQLRRWVDAPADVEDLTQLVLLRLHERGPRESEAIGPWVRRVAKNAAIDHLRTRRTRGPMPERGSEVDHEGQGTREVAAWLPALLDRVPEPYRSAVRAVDLEGLSQGELASRLGLSPSGARSRVQRGRSLLKAELLACCPVRFEEGEVVDTGRNCGGC